jgi:hypothetical protein
MRKISRTGMLSPVEQITTDKPSLGPKRAAQLGTIDLQAKTGSMNMLPSMRTIMACIYERLPLWIIGPSITRPMRGLATYVVRGTMLSEGTPKTSARGRTISASKVPRSMSKKTRKVMIR